MTTRVCSAGLFGVDGFAVTVECSVQDRIGGFEVVGLPDAAVRESKERILAAASNAGYELPDGAITVNLAPADMRKEGTGFDFAILMAVLAALGVLRAPAPAPDGGAAGGGDVNAFLADKCFIGELSLTGEIRGVHGVLGMCLAARDSGCTELYVSKENAAEASVVEGIRVFGVSSVREAVEHFNEGLPFEQAVFDRARFYEAAAHTTLDFSEVKGQERVKRAIEIAAAGGHNLLMIGPPGTGKSMLAKRIPTILPAMTFDEAQEVTKIHSAAGLLPVGTSLLTARPFRAPHHTVSSAAMAGGGRIPAPGEISLSHNGVLFLDELPEFPRDTTEVLRQPLEDGCVTINRTGGRFTFPSTFMLVCAMNPCRCGYFGHPTHPCTCRADDIKKYVSRISGPLLDRIDIQIEVPSLSFEQLTGEENAAPPESSAQIRERVNRARAFALARFRNTAGTVDPAIGDPTRPTPIPHSNAEMTPTQIAQFCRLSDDAKTLMRRAFDSMALSARGYDRILKVARTIADLAESETVTAAHVAEAIQLRSLDRRYF